MARKSRRLMSFALGAAAVYAASSLLRKARAYGFRGRTALVTGGSRGLGLELARALVAEGARVAICARDESDLERARQELAANGGQVMAVACDLTDKTQVYDMCRRVESLLGGIDVLINNAGVIAVGPQESMTLRD